MGPPGVGLSQATPSGLAILFNNPTYANIFSPSRLFTPVGSNITEALVFVPGTNGAVRATVSGFGAVFTDVDQPDGSAHGEGMAREGRNLTVSEARPKSENRQKNSFPRRKR